MKDSGDHIDKIFRDKLGDQSFDIPNEFIDSLNNQLDEIEPIKERNGKTIFYILNSIFLFVFLTISVFPINKNSFSTHESETQIALKEKNNLKNRAVKTLANSDDSIIRNETIKCRENKNTLISDSTTEISNEINNEKQFFIVGENNLKINYPTKETLATIGSKLNSTQENKSIFVPPLEETKIDANYNNASDSKFISINKKEMPGNISLRKNIGIKKEEDNESKLIPNQEKEKKVNAPEENENSTNKFESENANNVLEENKESNVFIETITSKETVLTFDSITIENIVSNEDSIPFEDTVKVSETNKVEDTTNNNTANSKKWNIEYQLFGGANFGPKQLSNNTKSSASYSLEEKSILTPTFGFNINTTINNVNIGTGIEYFQIGEKFTLNSNTVFENDSVEIVGYIFDTVIIDSLTIDSIYVPIYDTVTYYDTLNSSENWSNSYTWLSVPLNIGYRFNFGKWALVPKVGVTFNFGLRNSDGRYFNANGNNTSISNYKPVSFNLDYLLQLEIRRAIYNTEIYLSPNYRGNITPMVLGTNTQKYQRFGLRLGIVLRF